MSRFDAKRRLSPLIFAAALFAIPQTLLSQATNPAPQQVPAPPVATAQPQPQKQPTPEEIGDSLTARQRYQAAIAAYEKAPEKTATLWNKMGIDYQMMFNSRDATRCYKESLKLNPHNSQVLNNLGTVYASMKEYGQADRMYRKALKYGPQSALIYKNMGTNLLVEHKYDRGWDAYKRAIALDPQIFSDHSSPTVENPASVQERGAMNYYMALGCVRAGYADCALQYLRMALDEGFISRKKVATDAEFASLRDNPAFQQLLKEEDKRSQ
jgi:tetratricopeptide (TPR) repeat protein